MTTNINIIYQNARSIKSINRNNNEIENLRNYLSLAKPDFLTIVETWLDNTVDDNEFSVEGYEFLKETEEPEGVDYCFITRIHSNAAGELTLLA